MSAVTKLDRGGLVTYTTRAAPMATRFFLQASTDATGVSLPVSVIYHVELCGQPDNSRTVDAYKVYSENLWLGGALFTIRNEGTWPVEVWTDYA
jgi:hypothetical protein